MKSDYGLTIRAFNYLQSLVKPRLRDDPLTVVCLGWGRWENAQMQIMPGLYPDPSFPDSPPVYDFHGLLVSFAFPINTIGIPLDGVITFQENRLVFMDSVDCKRKEVVEGIPYQGQILVPKTIC